MKLTIIFNIVYEINTTEACSIREHNDGRRQDCETSHQ